MPGYTFPILFEPLKANNSIQTIFDTNTLVAPIKTAIAGYIATLDLPTAETAHLSWENCGAEIYLEQLVATYHLPSLGVQTPAPALKRSSTLADKVAEISSLNGQYPKCQLMLYVRNSAADPWVWKNTEVIQNYGNRANTLDLIPYLSQGTLDIFGKATQVGIQFISDPVFKTTLPVVGDRLSIKGALRVEVSQFDSKKNDVIQQLLDRIAMLELAVNGRLIDLPPNTLIGRNTGTGVAEIISANQFATPAMIEQAITDWIGTAPANLNTLIEFAAAINNDASFASTVTTALAAKVNIAGDVTINGNKTFTSIPRIQGITPGFWLDETDGGKGVFVVLDGGLLQIQRRASNFGVFEATLGSFNVASGDLNLNGFTSLGGSTAIKTKYVTGTTASTGGTAIELVHGLNPSKIISVETLVEYVPNNFISKGYTLSPGYEYDVIVGAAISVRLTADNSASILSKPVRAFIIYSA
ncbi:hypothetical protein QUB05_05580 [Microcoleus sp. F10-C6]|uniref:hypothetical protein n=1 Tax=unclassified Microcoleus TaxID=2642155 RepID=UPI002FD3EC78